MYTTMISIAACIIFLSSAAAEAKATFAGQLELGSMSVEFLDQPSISYALDWYGGYLWSLELWCCGDELTSIDSSHSPVDYSLVTRGGQKMSLKVNSGGIESSGEYSSSYKGINNAWGRAQIVFKPPLSTRYTGKVKISVPYRYELTRDNPERELTAIAFAVGTSSEQINLFDGYDVSASGSGTLVTYVDFGARDSYAIEVGSGGHVQVIPEPEVYALTSMGLIAIAARRRPWRLDQRGEG